MVDELPETLQQAEDALNGGRLETARLILIEYIRRVPTSERAWWLLSFAVAEKKQQIDCLERVLRINPEHEEARLRLDMLKMPEPPPPPKPPVVSPFIFDEEEAGSLKAAAPQETLPPPPFVQVPDLVEEEPLPPLEGEATPAEEAPLPPPPARKRFSPVILLIAAAFVVVTVAAVAIGVSVIRSLQRLAATPTPQVLSAIPITPAAATRTAVPTLTALPTSTRAPTWTPIVTAESFLPGTVPPADMIGPNIGQFAPDFQLVDVASGKLVTLSQYRGYPLLVFFWATWCDYCDEELAGIESIYEEFKDRGLVVIGINVDETPGAILSAGQQYGIQFALVQDKNGDAASSYAVDSIPRNFFIRSNGRISFVSKGVMSVSQMQGVIQPLFIFYSTPTP